jgi:hypothetical protein
MKDTASLCCFVAKWGGREGTPSNPYQYLGAIFRELLTFDGSLETLLKLYPAFIYMEYLVL